MKMTVTTSAVKQLWKHGRTLELVVLALMIVGVVRSSPVVASPGELLQEFHLPGANENAQFGRSVAGLGNTVLVGASGENAAYLLDNSTGEVLQGFVDPDGVGIAGYASYVTGRDDRVLISSPNANNGAPGAGAVHLFDGQTAEHLHTYGNPTSTPNGQFGSSIAFVGDRVLVGAPYDEGGTAYLFEQNGTLVTAFANPEPSNGRFGISVAAMADYLLISSSAERGKSAPGAGYLFDQSGELLKVFTNPAAEGGNSFGEKIAAVGKNVVVSAYLDDLEGTDAGAAYLFDGAGPYNGAAAPLLHTLQSPTPRAGANFGWSLATMGNHVAVGHHEDTVLGNSATVSLFDGTTGERLFSVEDPSPGGMGVNGFGYAIGGSPGHLVVGAFREDHGVQDAGAVYLFDVPLSDRFDNGVLDSDSWTTGGRKISWTADEEDPPGADAWAWSFDEIVAADGYMSARVQGPRSERTYGAVAWVQSDYDFNDGDGHALDFAWKADIGTSPDDRAAKFFVQITDGYIPPFSEEHEEFYDDDLYLSSGRSAAYRAGTTDFLWREHPVVGPLRGALYESDTNRAVWSLIVSPSGVARLYDGAGGTGALIHEDTLNPDKAWHLRFMVAAATSFGFPGADAHFDIYDFGEATFLPGDVNADGEVSGLDVDAFLAAIFTADNFNYRADVNGDGLVNGLDIAPFVSAVLNGTGTANANTGVAVPEPSTGLLLLVGLACAPILWRKRRLARPLARAIR